MHSLYWNDVACTADSMFLNYMGIPPTANFTDHNWTCNTHVARRGGHKKYQKRPMPTSVVLVD